VSYGREFVLTLFTRDPDLAARADRAGVDRIGPDLERIGKDERQGKLKTWISDHTGDDVPAVRARLSRARLFVRTNPPHAGLGEEIETLLAAGAQVLMLPMFRTPGERSCWWRLPLPPGPSTPSRRCPGKRRSTSA